MLKSFTFLNLLADLPPVVYNLECFKRGRDYLCLALISTDCSLISQVGAQQEEDEGSAFEGLRFFFAGLSTIKAGYCYERR